MGAQRWRAWGERGREHACSPPRKASYSSTPPTHPPSCSDGTWHFVQIVSKDVYEVGCGYTARCREITCQYLAPADYDVTAIPNLI